MDAPAGPERRLRQRERGWVWRVRAGPMHPGHAARRRPGREAAAQLPRRLRVTRHAEGQVRGGRGGPGEAEEGHRLPGAVQHRPCGPRRCPEAAPRTRPAAAAPGLAELQQPAHAVCAVAVSRA